MCLTTLLNKYAQNVHMSVTMSQVFSRDNENLAKLVICRAKDKISTELDGETVILDIASGVYSGLDPVGTTIWNLLEKSVSFTAIVKEIVGTYDVSEDQCISDLCDFLTNLFENGLIVVKNALNP